MTARTHVFKSESSKLGFSSRLANLGDINVFVAPKNTSADPFQIENWVLLGIVDGQAEINPNFGLVEINTGAPRTRKVTLQSEQLDSMSLSFSHLTMKGMSMLFNNGAEATITAASDGQTTVSSSTDNFTTVVADSSNIAEGDLIVVGNTIQEYCFVENVNSTTITHSLLSQAPSASTTFKKVDGTSTSASGIVFDRGSNCEFGEFEWIIVYRMGCTKNYFLQHRSRGQAIAQSGFRVQADAPATGQLLVNFIDSTSDTVRYGKDYFVPTES